MEFKEYVGGRWVMFLAGLVWTPVLPAAYALLFRELMRQNVALIILITLCFVLLQVAAVVLLKNGIAGLIANGRTRLILLDDKLQIITVSGKDKGRIATFGYADVSEFCFIAHGSKQDKKTKRDYVEQNASGLILFTAQQTEYYISIYNAYPAAQAILERLQEDQIDLNRTELDKTGIYTPKN